MILTDPAKELAETLALLASEPNMQLTDKIATQARVDAWSPEFFRILFEILNRIALVGSKVAELPLDEDVKKDALNSIGVIKSVFQDPSVLNTTSAQVRPKISGSNTTVLKMLSIMIRENVSYPLLTEEGKSEIIAEVTKLRDWLAKLETDEKDFIRAALIEGLDTFLFRIERLSWFGHGYTIGGLKEVIRAYLSLQGARVVDANGAELQDAILAKAKATLVRILQIFDVAKDNVDRADWALRAYGAVSALSDGSSTVAGLLQ